MVAKITDRTAAKKNRRLLQNAAHRGLYILVLSLTCLPTLAQKAPGDPECRHGKLGFDVVENCASPRMEPKMSPPANLSELWSRFLSSISETSGFVDKVHFESLFGIVLKETEEDSNENRLGAKYRHSVQVEITGLGGVKIALFDDESRKLLSIRWETAQHGQAECLSITAATEDLGNLGWVLGPRSIQPGQGIFPFHPRDFQKNNGPDSVKLNEDFPVITLFTRTLRDGCVSGIATRIPNPAHIVR